MDICALGLFMTSQYLINIILASEIHPNLLTKDLCLYLVHALLCIIKCIFSFAIVLLGKREEKLVALL